MFSIYKSFKSTNCSRATKGKNIFGFYSCFWFIDIGLKQDNLKKWIQHYTTMMLMNYFLARKKSETNNWWLNICLMHGSLHLKSFTPKKTISLAALSLFCQKTWMALDRFNNELNKLFSKHLGWNNINALWFHLSLERNWQNRF